MLDTIELLIDEENDKPGVFAISLVDAPAIESNFVALNKHRVEMKIVDEEKRMVVGLALIPDKKIFRKNGDYEYNIMFSKDTVRKASELYLSNLRSNNTTVDHQMLVDGVYLSESWIVEDSAKDKTALYGIEAPIGSWAISMKVHNNEVWEDVKGGKYLGFSIEGIFDEKLPSKMDKYEEAWKKIQEILQD
jgi:hypothetical protein